MNSTVTMVQLAMAQDYWLQVMNLGQRIEAMQSVQYLGTDKSELKRFRRLLAYVYETHTDKVIAHQKQIMEKLGEI